MKERTYNNKRAGFTLVEMAFVAAIAGLILLFAAVTIQKMMETSRIRATKERIAIIEDTMVSYVQRNKELPCAARSDLAPGNAGYAEETFFAGPNICLDPSNDLADPGDDPAGISIVAGRDMGSGPEHVLIGALPTRALGLSDDFMLDGWGRKFTYVVTANQTDKSFSSSRGAIHVQDALAAPRSLLRADGTALYTLISHGQDGSGAFTINGQLFAALCGTTTAADPRDNENCDRDDNVFVSGLYSTAQGASHFDDIVSYVTFVPGIISDVCNRKLAFLSPADPDADADGCVRSPLTVVSWESMAFDCNPAMGSNRDPTDSAPVAGEVVNVVDSGAGNEECATLNFKVDQVASGDFSAGLTLALPESPGVFESNMFTAVTTGQARIIATLPLLYRHDTVYVPPASTADRWESALITIIRVRNVTAGTPFAIIATGDIVNPPSSLLGTGGAVGTTIGDVPIIEGNAYEIEIKIVSSGGGCSTSTIDACDYTAWVGTIHSMDYYANGVLEIVQSY